MKDRFDPRPGDMVQVHLLTAYPAALLNRDDQGFAKRITFGGAPRIRVSSQCLKKHWRDAEAIRSLGDQADRSIRVFEQRVADQLHEVHKVPEEEALIIARYLMSITVDTEPDTDKYGENTTRSKQLLVLTAAETSLLAELGKEVLEKLRSSSIAVTTKTPQEALHEAFLYALDAQGVLANIGITVKPADLEKKQKRESFLRTVRDKYMRMLPASVDTAMFGRMVTSDLFARVDAAVNVAHAFTTHQGMGEPDYFTAVDTLKGDEDDAGAGLIQETELTSGVFYVYAVIDMNQLRENLGGDADRAEAMARALVQTMTSVSPGAKRGSTAPYTRAEFVLLERGGEQPRSLANAFLKPVADGGENGAGTMEQSVEVLAKYRAELEGMYGSFDGKIAVSTIHRGPAKRLGSETAPLDAALDRIFGSGT